MDCINRGKKEGATVALGGNRHGQEGYFIQPIVFTDVTQNMTIVQEEIFGRVICVQKFKDKAEAIKIGNSTSYGMRFTDANILPLFTICRFGRRCPHQECQYRHPCVQRHQGWIGFVPYTLSCQIPNFV